ncbi:MAG: hypothetical protein SFX18_13170 [Pirellulales bacterium]|nr:hypothetical protein [Pirellulales bacterium]
MIHYSCDLCKRTLDPQDDLRYVVKLEVFATLDQEHSPLDEDQDNLLELQDVLQRLDDHADETISSEVYQSLKFDLCPDCRKKFLKNPLGREVKQFDFSKN